MRIEDGQQARQHAGLRQPQTRPEPACAEERVVKAEVAASNSPAEGDVVGSETSDQHAKPPASIGKPSRSVSRRKRPPHFKLPAPPRLPSEADRKKLEAWLADGAGIKVHLADHQHHVKLDPVVLRQLVRAALVQSGIRKGTVGVALVNNRTIRRLNRLFLQEDEATDVLSFPLETSRRNWEGEVVVSTEQAVAVAGDYGTDPVSESLLYVLHGVLHLAGYDDRTTRQRMKMERKQRELLRLFGYEVRLAPAARKKSSGQPVPLRRSKKQRSSG